MRSSIWTRSVVVWVSGLMLGGVSAATAAIIHVDQSAVPGGDGPSWGTAFRHPQDGLDVAVAGDQIWVAAGTYLPSKETEPGNPRTVTFQLISGMELYGAFPPGGGDGTFGARDTTNPAHETTLSGAIGVPWDPADNAYHVLIASGTDATAVLNGFTIAAGNANGTSPHDRGGGLYIDDGSPSMASCTFSENSPTLGGGLYNTGSDPTVTNCTFSGNSAGDGGGIYNTDNSNPTVSNCTFTDSSVDGGNSGGGATARNGFGRSDQDRASCRAAGRCTSISYETRDT